MDERRHANVALSERPVHLMPAVADVLPQIALPLALWANTRIDGEADVRPECGSLDEQPGAASPTYTISSLKELPVVAPSAAVM